MAPPPVSNEPLSTETFEAVHCPGSVFTVRFWQTALGGRNAAKQSSRPAPVVESSPGGGTSTAVLASRARMVAGAVAAPSSCRTMASQPAVCGAAADVPKNRQSPGLTAGQVPEPKVPTPLTCTPSAPRKSRPWNCCAAGPATPLAHG